MDSLTLVFMAARFAKDMHIYHDRMTLSKMLLFFCKLFKPVDGLLPILSSEINKALLLTEIGAGRDKERVDGVIHNLRKIIMAPYMAHR